jgi:DeoR family fructose operon transcriptional repressor
MQQAGARGPEERAREIEQLTVARGQVRIDELAQLLEVSEMTIRRDLDELQGLGVLRRVRGGAVAVGPEPFAERHRTDARAKGLIAEKLAHLVPDRGTVAFDASTTVHRFAADLRGASDLVVLTNGIDTFQVLRDKPGISPTLTGGHLEPRTGSLVGPVASRSASDFLFDVLVCSAAAVDPLLGASEASVDEAEVKRSLQGTSARVVLAVSHAKLGGRAPARVFAPHEVDLMVTDLDPGDERLAPYRDAGMEIL